MYVLMVKDYFALLTKIEIDDDYQIFYKLLPKYQRVENYHLNNNEIFTREFITLQRRKKWYIQTFILYQSIFE